MAEVSMPKDDRDILEVLKIEKLEVERATLRLSASLGQQVAS